MIVLIIILVVCIAKRIARKRAGESFNPGATRRANTNNNNAEGVFEGKADFDDLKKAKSGVYTDNDDKSPVFMVSDKVL